MAANTSSLPPGWSTTTKPEAKEDHTDHTRQGAPNDTSLSSEEPISKMIGTFRPTVNPSMTEQSEHKDAAGTRHTTTNTEPGNTLNRNHTKGIKCKGRAMQTSLPTLVAGTQLGNDSTSDINQVTIDERRRQKETQQPSAKGTSSPLPQLNTNGTTVNKYTKPRERGLSHADKWPIKENTRHPHEQTNRDTTPPAQTGLLRNETTTKTPTTATIASLSNWFRITARTTETKPYPGPKWQGPKDSLWRSFSRLRQTLCIQKKQLCTLQAAPQHQCRDIDEDQRTIRCLHHGPSASSPCFSSRRPSRRRKLVTKTTAKKSVPPQSRLSENEHRLLPNVDNSAPAAQSRHSVHNTDLQTPIRTSLFCGYEADQMMNWVTRLTACLKTLRTMTKNEDMEDNPPTRPSTRSGRGRF